MNGTQQSASEDEQTENDRWIGPSAKWMLLDPDTATVGKAVAEVDGELKTKETSADTSQKTVNEYTLHEAWSRNDQSGRTQKMLVAYRDGDDWMFKSPIRPP